MRTAGCSLPGIISLPLMGIGNRYVENLVSGLQASSLPLMGIGNDGVYSVHGQPPLAHYPSWGLETPQQFLRKPRCLNLITPHGDWKPHTDNRVLLQALKLITPHGDWKRHTHAQSNCSYRLLITPHGDWKPAMSTRAFWNCCSSLPLMGIGNDLYTPVA